MSDPVYPRAGLPATPEEDLARALPPTAPPHPVRRAAAIAAALRQFDGEEAKAPVPKNRAPPWRIGRVQLGALASAALVVAVGLPAALQHAGDHPTSSRPVARTGDADLAVAADNAMVADEALAPSTTSAPPPAAVRAAPMPAPARSAAATPTPDEPAAEAVADRVAATPPPPPPAAPAPLPAPAPEAVASLGEARRASPDGSDVVVTGSRISPQAKAAARRGDWNTCTVLDPDHSLLGCGRAIRARVAGQAGAAIADGLAAGWRQNWSDAVAAFDHAIELQPHSGIAYLNRGLAQQRLGATEEARADLDRAVRLDGSARAYYARALLRRERGDIPGARADEERAVGLDADYAQVVPD